MARSCSGWGTANFFSRANSGVGANEPFTIACWQKTATVNTGASRVAVGLGVAAGGAMHIIGIGSTGTRFFQKFDGVTAGTATQGTITANTWEFIAGLAESNTSRYCYSAGTLGAQNTTNVSDFTPDRASIGIIDRSTNDFPHNGNVALATIWDVVLSVGELDALNRGVHPARIRPKNIVRAWWNPTAGSRLVDFSGSQLAMSLTGTVTDDAFGPPVEPFPFMYGGPFGARSPEIGVAAGGTTTSLSSSDGVFFLDLRTMDLRRTETDRALLSDAVLTQAIRARLADDGMFVSDSRVSAFYKTALDLILLGDETTKRVYRTLLDLLLLVDSVTATQPGGAVINTVSVADAVFLLDLSVRSITSLHRDTVLLGEDRLTSIIRARFGDDGMFLTDTIRRVQSVILDDQLLLLDTIIKRLTKIVTDNPLLFSDDVTTALAQASAQALVYARLRTLGLFSPVRGVNDLLSLTTRSSDFMSIQTGIVRPN